MGTSKFRIRGSIEAFKEAEACGKMPTGNNTYRQETETDNSSSNNGNNSNNDNNENIKNKD